MADWKTYKSLRLKSLQDSPDSFGSTFEQEKDYNQQEWMSRLDPENRAKFAIPLMVERDGLPVGLAYGKMHDPELPEAHIYQMWVSPTARGSGVGNLMVSEIIKWAKAKKLKRLELGVTTTNLAAVGLYKSLGFENFGELEPLRRGSEIVVQHMRLYLD